MKLEEMRPHQDCYDLVGRRLTFLAPVGKEALVQSWHLEESHWHEHGHTMEEMRAVEGPIWLTDPAKLYSKPPTWLGASILAVVFLIGCVAAALVVPHMGWPK